MWQLDSWNPDYRLPSRAALDESVEAACPAVLGLEGSWEARRPPPVAPEDWPLLYFVDGRLRIEARVWGTGGEAGLLASLVVGALVRDAEGLRLWETPVIHRLLLHNSLTAPAAPGYTPVPLPEMSPEQMPAALTALLRRQEAALIERLPEGLVVADGQLTRAHRPGVLGYTKAQAVRYLPPEALPLLNKLQAGERTPIFLLEASHSWYVRLPLPSIFAPGTGLLRVETPAGPELPTTLADLSVSLFCLTATTPGRDPRAPQSLHPVAGLEQLLGRYLGDARLVRRGLLEQLA
jgi:hypothetical protein